MTETWKKEKQYLQRTQPFRYARHATYLAEQKVTLLCWFCIASTSCISHCLPCVYSKRPALEDQSALTKCRSPSVHRAPSAPRDGTPLTFAKRHRVEFFTSRTVSRLDVGPNAQRRPTSTLSHRFSIETSTQRQLLNFVTAARPEMCSRKLCLWSRVESRLSVSWGGSSDPFDHTFLAFRPNPLALHSQVTIIAFRLALPIWLLDIPNSADRLEQLESFPLKPQPQIVPEQPETKFVRNGRIWRDLRATGALQFSVWAV